MLKAKRAERKAAGKCRECGEPARTGKTRCIRCTERQRGYELRCRYGITKEQYEARAAEQENVCALCFKPPAPGEMLAVDHDHATGVVRGLLCLRCNVAFERVDTTGNWLVNAAHYQLRWRQAQQSSTAPEGVSVAFSDTKRST